MEYSDKTTLCRSKFGLVSVFNNAVAFELTFKQTSTLLDSEKVHQLNTQLQDLQETDWLQASQHRFIFICFPQLEGQYILTEEEVKDLKQLLLEASAMIKVHHRLYVKYTPRIN